tara:strand:- start:46 stop:189 length:144 start_codon:yes stop_codon:yes gene_type:complete
MINLQILDATEEMIPKEKYNWCPAVSEEVRFLIVTSGQPCKTTTARW